LSKDEIEDIADVGAEASAELYDLMDKLVRLPIYSLDHAVRVLANRPRDRMRRN
jgi:hypothetical protein